MSSGRRPTAIVAALCIAFVAAGCASAAPPSARVLPPSTGPSPVVEKRCDAHTSVVGFFHEHLSAEAWRDYVWRDSIQRGDLLAPAALGVVAVFARPLDHTVTKSLSGALGHNEWIGDTTQVGLVAGALAIGIFAPGEGRTAYEETWNQVEALGWTFGAVNGLKYAVGRKRPDASDLLSFPSGHTAAAFCAATLIARDKGPAWGVPAYGVAALTGFSRIESNRHFMSDVLTGAAIGTAVATVTDALHFGDGRPGEGISSCPIHVEAGTTEDGRPEIGVAVEF